MTSEPAFERQWRYLINVISGDPDHWLSRLVGMDRVKHPSAEFRAAALPLIARSIAVGDTFEDKVARRRPMLHSVAMNELEALVAAAIAAERGALSEPTEASTRAISGLTRDRIIDAAIATREPDGTWGTQAKAATNLGLADARRIRQVQGPARWEGIIADAKAKLAKG